MDNVHITATGCFIAFVSFILGNIYPKFVDFFFKNTALRLEKLEETFKCSRKITEYCNQISLFMALSVYCKTNNLSLESLSKLKTIDSPLPDLWCLLIFHLKAPQEIIDNLILIEQIILLVGQPITPGFLYGQKPIDLLSEGNSFKNSQLLIITGKDLQTSLQNWIISEKDISLSKMNPLAFLKRKANFFKFISRFPKQSNYT